MKFNKNRAQLQQTKPFSLSIKTIQLGRPYLVFKNLIDSSIQDIFKLIGENSFDCLQFSFVAQLDKLLNFGVDGIDIFLYFLCRKCHESIDCQTFTLSRFLKNGHCYWALQYDILPLHSNKQSGKRAKLYIPSTITGFFKILKTLTMYWQYLHSTSSKSKIAWGSWQIPVQCSKQFK